MTRASAHALLCCVFSKGDRLLLKDLDPAASVERVLALRHDSGDARPHGVRTILAWYDAWTSGSAEDRDRGLLRSLLSGTSDHDLAHCLGIEEGEVRREIERLYLQLYYEPAFARSSAVMHAANRLAAIAGT